MPFAAPTLSLKGRALKALAAREHSRAELERKLSRYEESEGQLSAVLDDLCAKGFIDEHRAAEALAYRRGQKLGVARVVQEMKNKGIDPLAIAQTAEQLKISELARARAVWQKKFGQPAASPRERSRQLQFLIARGFSAEIVRHVVAGADAWDE